MQVDGADKALFLIKKEGSEEYTEIAKSASKRLQKTLDGIRKKEAKAATASAAAGAAKETDEVAIIEDSSLPKAENVKIRQAGEKRGVRVAVRGWVATARIQSRKIVFIDLRDGSDLYLQCLLQGDLVYSIKRHS